MLLSVDFEVENWHLFSLHFQIVVLNINRFLFNLRKQLIHIHQFQFLYIFLHLLSNILPEIPASRLVNNPNLVSTIINWIHTPDLVINVSFLQFFLLQFHLLSGFQFFALSLLHNAVLLWSSFFLLLSGLFQTERIDLRTL